MARSPTILDDMISDVYVNRDDGSVTILHDKAFDDVLLGLTYNAHNGGLLFKFSNKEVFFGESLLDEFVPYFTKAKTVTLLQMDMDTKKPVAGVEVPLQVTFH